MSYGGKGDKRRPSKKNGEVLKLRWDLAFGSPESKKEAERRLVELGELKEVNKEIHPC